MRVLLFAFIFCSLQAFSQNNFYLKAGAGAGIASASYKLNDSRETGKDILSKQGMVNLGYNAGNWQIESGVGCWQSGMIFSKDYTITVGGLLDPNHPGSGHGHTSIQRVDYDMQSRHVVVPLSVGYTIKKEGKLSFTPALGFAAVYNLDEKVTTGDPYQQETIPSITYAKNKISGMLLIRFELQYRLSDKCSLWCYPSYQVTSSTIKDVYSNYLLGMNEQALLFNTGFRYNIYTRKQATPENVAKDQQ